MSKLLAGRVLAGAGLNTRFLQTVFEQCPELAWTLHESIIKCFLAKDVKDVKDVKEEGKKEGKSAAGAGGRSNHQRLMAIELYQILIKVAMKDSKAKQKLADNLELLSGVVCKVVETSDSWIQKKVKKTGMCVGLFVKAAKTLVSNDVAIEFDRNIISQAGAKLIKAIETATEADKTMSNLKGKSKEI